MARTMPRFGPFFFFQKRASAVEDARAEENAVFEDVDATAAATAAATVRHQDQDASCGSLSAIAAAAAAAATAVSVEHHPTTHVATTTTSPTKVSTISQTTPTTPTTTLTRQSPSSLRLPLLRITELPLLGDDWVIMS